MIDCFVEETEEGEVWELMGGGGNCWEEGGGGGGGERTSQLSGGKDGG